MKRMLVFLVIVSIVSIFLSGCLNPPNQFPPGYEVKDYCQKDSDCVRLKSCCDCGLGKYVNIYNQEEDCTEPVCKCAIVNSYGACQSNKCVAVANFTDKKFCNVDSDCICMGIDSETGSCYLGNKDYYENSVVNKTYICPDFCTGIAGNFEIKCAENVCSQVKK